MRKRAKACGLVLLLVVLAALVQKTWPTAWLVLVVLMSVLIIMTMLVSFVRSIFEWASKFNARQQVLDCGDRVNARPKQLAPQHFSGHNSSVPSYSLEFDMSTVRTTIERRLEASYLPL